MKTTNNTPTEGTTMSKPSDLEMVRVLSLIGAANGRPVAYAARHRAVMRYMQRIGFLDERLDRKAGGYVIDLYPQAREFMAAHGS